jgi:hypothetical protein
MPLFAVIVAMGLGVMAGLLVRPTSGPAATHTNFVSTEAGPNAEAAPSAPSSTGPVQIIDGTGPLLP